MRAFSGWKDANGAGALAHVLRLASATMLVFTLAAFLALQLVSARYEVAISVLARTDADLGSRPESSPISAVLRRLAGEPTSSASVRLADRDEAGLVEVIATADTPQEALRLAQARALEIGEPPARIEPSAQEVRLAAERLSLEGQIAALGAQLPDEHPRLSIMRLRLIDLDAELAALRAASPPQASGPDVGEARELSPPVIPVTIGAAVAGFLAGGLAGLLSSLAARRDGRRPVRLDTEEAPAQPAPSRSDPVPSSQEGEDNEPASLDHLADALSEEPVSRVLFVSSDGDEQTALALARRLSARGGRVLLADLSPSQAAWRDAGPRVESPGLAGLVAGLDLAALVRRDRESSAHLLPAGGAAGRASSAVSALEAARGSYDHILVDCGSMDAEAVGGLTDSQSGVILTRRASAMALYETRLRELRGAGIDDVLVVEAA